VARSRSVRARAESAGTRHTEPDLIGGPASKRRYVGPYGPEDSSLSGAGDTDQGGRVPPPSEAAYEYPVGQGEHGRSHLRWPNWQNSAPPFRGLYPSAQIIRGWWEYQRLQSGTPEQRRALQAGHPAQVCASSAEVRAHIAAGGQQAIELVAAILSTSRSDTDVSLVGAGPLEDLVHKHGDTLVDAIEGFAARDAWFAYALSRVWLAHGVLRPGTELRLSKWITVTGTKPSRR
jgi:hypothetical protein